MPFSEQFLREGRQELARLEAERQRLDARISALRDLLRAGSQPALPMGETEQSAVVPQEIGPSPLTFKEVVSRIIRVKPGIKVREITHHLRVQEYPIKGQTDIGHRVYNEVWRMKKRGEVVETPDGGYRLA